LRLDLRKYRFIIPGITLALAWQASRMNLPGAYLPVLRVLPEALAVLMLPLAWRYRRGRLALVSILLGGTNFFARLPGNGGFSGMGAQNFHFLSYFLLINLGLLMLISEHPLFHRIILGHTSVMTFVIGLKTVYFTGESSGTGSTLLAVFQTTQALDLLFFLLFFFGVLAAILRKGIFESTMLWVFAAVELLMRTRAPGLTVHLVLGASEFLLLLSLMEDSYRLAFIDQLTELPGRRALDEMLRNLGDTYALAMVDIDHFKKFNDRWGHATGDQALRMVARKLACVRGSGRAFRYGGEEFTIVFPGVKPEDARPHLEEIRQAVAEEPFGIRSPGRPTKKGASRPSSSGKKVHITVSIGLSGPTKSRTESRDVLKAADKALYRAKKSGRNRVVLMR